MNQVYKPDLEERNDIAADTWCVIVFSAIGMGIYIYDLLSMKPSKKPEYVWGKMSGFCF